MKLDELILHPRTAEAARHYSQRLPHALIIEGPTGTGVATIARALATAVGSPEFVIFPKKKVKNEWAIDLLEGSIIIDDIRQLYEQTRTKQPGESVYIIDTGEKSLTVAAQNAFLKLLEEPRDGVHFIIATHQRDLLLPTIVSRSQQLTVIPVTQAQTSELIASLAIADPTVQARLAFVGRGRPALIKQLASDSTTYEKRVAIMSDAKTMLGSDSYARLTVAHRYKDSRADALTLIDDMNYQLKTIIHSHPDSRVAEQIEQHLVVRKRIASGGNIRLQLAADVIQ